MKKTSIEKRCQVCGKKFFVKLSRIKDGRGKFCSQKCYWGNKILTKCEFCGKEFLAYPCNLKNNRSKYCNKECYYKNKIRKCSNKETCFKKGHIPHNYNGGEIVNSQGYVLILDRDNPRANRHGYVRKHIFIVEKFLNRYISKEEVVHHIDGNKQNNTLDNLYLFRNNSEHAIYHVNADRYHTCNKIIKSNII